MSTPSTYSSNKLKQVLENNTQHFVIKSFLTTTFEYDRKEPEHHLYWVNLNKGVDEETMRYKHLSNKKMNSKELQFFYDNIHNYNEEIQQDSGSVWEHKTLGFDKELVKCSLEDALIQNL